MKGLTVTRPRKNRDLTSLLIAIAVGLGVYLIGCHVARAAGMAANPTAAVEAGGNAALDVLSKDGPWWAVVGVLNVALRLWLDHQHRLKQGRLLTALTSLSAVLVAVASWHWDGGPAVGILTALIAGGTLLLHPSPPAPPSKPGPVLVTSLLLALTGCTAAQRAELAHAAWDCTAPARADAVAAVTPAVVSVIKAAGSADGRAIDLSTVKAAITKANLLSEAGIQLSCATASAIAILTAPAPAPAPGAPLSAPYELDPIAVRATWAAVKREQLGGADFKVSGGAVL